MELNQKPTNNKNNLNEVKFFGLFGGQGYQSYFKEFIETYFKYKDILNPFVSRMSDVLNKMTQIDQALAIHTEGLNVLQWLENEKLTPNIQYLCSAPVSLPLIALSQLSQYLALAKSSNDTFEQSINKFSGCTGHSQGIISAVVVSASSNEEQFYKNSETALKLLFWIGARSHMAYPPVSLNPNILQDSLSNGEGVPSMMLAVKSLDYETLRRTVDSSNKILPKERQIHISLYNEPESFVCVGHPKSLYGLNLSLRRIKAKKGIDQARIPFSQRKKVFSNYYLSITSPFHSHYLNSAVPIILDDIKEFNIKFTTPLAIPVYSTYDGSNLQQCSELELNLVEQICVKTLNFEKSIKNCGTYVVDFGPGKTSGVGSLLNTHKIGLGTRVIIANMEEVNDTRFLPVGNFTDSVKNKIRKSWKELYSPRLVTLKDGKVLIDTKMSRLFGKPPMMVAGMTPCTANPGLVIAVTNAGYHIELAGGGQHTPDMFKKNIEHTLEMINPGDSISVNLLFLNARLWAFQFPMLVKMRKEGYPIDGICIAAGVPSFEVANEYVTQIKESGMKYVAFKPGSLSTIFDVLKIAKANSDFPIILQWTGGRAGGHHSFEDLHHPLIEAYSYIRECDNVVLIVGSGFGDSIDTYPYLTGEWSLKYNCPEMPVDGLLFGSRLMVCKESMASEATKQAIIDAPGVDDGEWEGTYHKEVGGVITVKSELGEPIHKIATRGVKLWSEFDKNLFCLPKEKMLQKIKADKKSIIERLNADYQKVWFGKKENGKTIDLEEMTYYEVINRLVDLLFIRSESRWLDVTLRNLVGDFIVRVEERFATTQKIAYLCDYDLLNTDPYALINTFSLKYMDIKKTLLTTQDVQYFINLCSNPVMKPVPFIPLLDEKFEFWFKKDSLWQSEDLGAVQGEDVQRCCILQGPVAAKYSKIINEPAKDILENINNGLILQLNKGTYREADNPEYLDFAIDEEKSDFGDINIQRKDNITICEIPQTVSSIPDSNIWIRFLSQGAPSWLRACMTSPAIISGKNKLPNYIKRMFYAKKLQSVEVNHVNGLINCVKIFDQGVQKTLKVCLSIDNHNVISLDLFENIDNKKIILPLKFNYSICTPYALIHEVLDTKDSAIKNFYSQLWDDEKLCNKLQSKNSYEFLVSKSEIIKFCQAVGNKSEAYIDRDKGFIEMPLDYSIVVSWKALTREIISNEIEGNLLKLVHLSNEFKVVSNKMIYSGDKVTVSSQIHSMVITPQGKVIKVCAIISKENVEAIQVLSSFLIRGKFSQYSNTFDKSEKLQYKVTLSSVEKVAILESKEWVKWDSSKVNLEENQHKLDVGSVLLFNINYEYYYLSEKEYSKVVTKGSILLQQSTKQFVKCAEVQFSANNIKANPIEEYLKRHGNQIEEKIVFEDGGYSVIPNDPEFNTKISAPASNFAYSQVSKDYNPIHTNQYFAQLANLDNVITHGMWTSASIKSIVEVFAAENIPSRIKMYHMDFLDMVKSNDLIEIKAIHVGMRGGRKIIKIEAYNQFNSKIAQGFCEVEQPVTAYVFTGQGSQEKGMGMDLYQNSLVAKQIWDNADKHFVENYGFSILNIVKNNPSEITVHFGGKKGKHIKNNYMKMCYDVVDSQDVTQTLPLFPNITEESEYHVFKSSLGLLSATQFTQPALTLIELASFEDLKSKGLIQANCCFAGHSLGEYAALASIGNMLPIESLVDLVFYRGMTMQNAVRRDDLGRSTYGMIAVNPQRVAVFFDQKYLQYIVDAISKHSKKLIQIVNYNVENWQYVLAGELTNLQALGDVLDEIKKNLEDFVDIIKNQSDKIDELLDDLVAKHICRAIQRSENGYLLLNRTNATIPLSGIDVPFHSSFLKHGVDPFRSYLQKKIDKSYIDVNILLENYIPNLVAKPFSLKKEYIQETYDLTHSPVLRELLSGYDKRDLNNPFENQITAYILVIEMLSYQFASPVRWIETQDVLFKDRCIERLIEIGPSPVLCGMANRTLKFKYEQYDDALIYRRQILCYSKDTSDIYYLNRDVGSQEVLEPVKQITQIVQNIESKSALLDDAVCKPIEDVPIPLIDFLRLIISQKTKQQVDKITGSQSIKDISKGKSTLQNEILGDLGKEFEGNVPDKSEEIPLVELSSNIQPFFKGRLGKYTEPLVNKVLSSKLSAGLNYSSVRNYINNTYGFGPLRTDGLLMYLINNEPENRLANEQETNLWIKSGIDKYCKDQEVVLSKVSSSSNDVAQKAIDPNTYKKLTKRQDMLFKRQYNAYKEYLNTNIEKKGNELHFDIFQKKLDFINEEIGVEFIDNANPIFQQKKVRHYTSYWNWSRQDAMLLYYDIIFGKLTAVDRDITAKCINIINRSDRSFLDFMKYKLSKCDVNLGENYKLAYEFGTELVKNVEELMESKPRYKDVRYPLAPNTFVTSNGSINYTEVPRKNIKKLSQFVEEMRNGTSIAIQDKKLYDNLNNLIRTITKDDKVGHSIQMLQRTLVSTIEQYKIDNKIEQKMPLLSMKSKTFPNGYQYNSSMTDFYLDVLLDITKNGVSFHNKKVLITGCGRNSIGSDILKGLLSGGAHVVVTTSKFTRQTKDYYQDLYHAYGAKDSHLVVLPFNQGSKTDIRNLVDYIYNETGLCWDLDFIIPFAAVPENGREIDSIDSYSEFSHRLMLINVIRLLGEVKLKKEKFNYITRPAHVLLPLSPNHGIFGGDGLYSESKMGLENLMSRWYSESWKDYINVIGVCIGWTRGTGLMNQNNIVCEKIEEYGVRTFSTQEMSFSILGLLHPKIISLSQKEPILANLNGGFEFLENFKQILANTRKEIMESASIKKAITAEKEIENVSFVNNQSLDKKQKITPRARFGFEFPELKSYEEYREILSNDILDLESVVVVTGFSELGPWGNSRTRWEMEKDGYFSLEGCIEMAWMMGYIKNFNGMLPNGKKYSGWVDTTTNLPVDDFMIKNKYEGEIIKHSGIRIIEPALFDGYDPNNKNVLHEVLISNDLDPLEVTQEEAHHFKRKHGDKVNIYSENQIWYVEFLKGCSVYVPKALQFSRLVAGQIPTGWNAATYGVPKDIIDQVDKITLFVLVSTVEALVSSGITDPYEFYKYVQINKIGNTVGSGIGGMRSLKRMYKDRFLDKPVQKDILQETFINTMPAWINMLLISGSGPIKTPVGACATAVESVEIGVDTILSKKASVCIVGGYDDFHEEGSYEFANMNATSNSLEEFEKGREPNEMSRPTTSSRAGFMESQGAGIQILMNAQLAIEMGVPIYAILALTNTAMDKEGRSVPAPGQGILTTAAQLNNKYTHLNFNLENRKRQFNYKKEELKKNIQKQYTELTKEVNELRSNQQFSNKADELEYYESKKRFIDSQALKEEKDARKLWGNDFYKQNDEISHLVGALAVYGLTIDDIGVASFHGTGTKANDTNETQVVNRQFSHLNRTKGNACPAVFQKYLTGHPKGAAAAWMLNGVIQSLNSGYIPGNRNADDIDPSLKQYEFVMFPSKTIRTDGIKAGLLKSFGFGQVGGEILVIHRNYLFGALSKDQFDKYAYKNNDRYLKSYRYLHNAITNLHNLVRLKTNPPYSKKHESAIYLNPAVRAKYDNNLQSYNITFEEGHNRNIDEAFFESLSNGVEGRGVGIDVQLISEINVTNQTFVTNNFTKQEIEYCRSRADPQSSFCGKWSAKEAVIKAVSSYDLNMRNVWNKGSAAPLRDIEVVSSNSNAPRIILKNEAREIVEKLGISGFKVSISHSGSYALAVAIAISK